MSDLIKDYMNFLNNCKTERLCIQDIIKKAGKEGYKDINKKDKTIEFNGIDGFIIAWITQYDEETVEEVEIIKYNENGELDGNNEEITIIKNGKLVIK